MLKNGKKPAQSGSNHSTVDTLVGRQTELLGDITFTGGLHIDGTVKGKVSAGADKDALLSVSETGVIEGDVHVAHVVLNGSIHGDVHALGQLTLHSCARVNGNVHYRVMEMASGATINGQMVHEVESERGNVTSLEGRGGSASQADGEQPDAVNLDLRGSV
ncbi:bactofilin family protein [Algiphilus sp.]|uniref:bactofilin family protein n=1 Tax=Algiphilus sp. TaxID=1872431 RepID=UPI0025BD8ECC|nr:polymer-forming cytoskeletal protein [Algiphilus sp.]MCK5769786.1 polymer-forming cytoskeletal protein [Algiphilus sp.]